MNNINKPQAQDDSLKALNEFLLAILFVVCLIWILWMRFYFHEGIGHSIILLIDGTPSLIRPFFVMCFVTSLFINAFLFTYFASLPKKDQHHRGSKRID